MSGEPFHRCTHTAMSPQGDIYVSDGYGNSRVHKYSPDGKLLMSWGGPGTDPGEFNIVHNITCDADGWVYVADRENHRVQVFDGNGKYETQWNNLHRPCGLFMPPGKCPICYIGELGAVQPVNRNVPNLGPRVTIVDHTGKRIARLGGLGPGLGPTEFLAPHGLDRGQPRRSLCRRGVVDQLAADLPRQAAAGQSAFAAQVPEGGIGQLVPACERMRRLLEKKEARMARRTSTITSRPVAMDQARSLQCHRRAAADRRDFLARCQVAISTSRRTAFSMRLSAISRSLLASPPQAGRTALRTSRRLRSFLLESRDYEDRYQLTRTSAQVAHDVNESTMAALTANHKQDR